MLPFPDTYYNLMVQIYANRNFQKWEERKKCDLQKVQIIIENGKQC